jgi:hypothetical protein
MCKTQIKLETQWKMEVLTVLASDDDGESVEEGAGVALLTLVEDGCDPPPAVPEGWPDISM